MKRVEERVGEREKRDGEAVKDTTPTNRACLFFLYDFSSAIMKEKE